jgi:nucleotide-binding universal stress UspA family protein
MKRMKTRNPRLRIVWALDAFGGGEARVLRAAAGPLGALARKIGAEIEPAYVLSLNRVAGPGYALPRAGFFLPAAARSLRSTLRRARAPATAAARIVVITSDSNAAAARALARHARDRGAAVVAAASHERRGAARLFLGSFTESLMTAARTPLLVLKPARKRRDRWERILFATDLSPASARAFRALLPLAARLRARVTVVHALRRPLFAAGVHVVGERDDASLPGREAAERRLGPYLASARRAGVSAVASVRGAPDDSISEAILQSADASEAGVVALAARSGAWRAAVVGSVARQVVRGPTRPVLLFPRA